MVENYKNDSEIKERERKFDINQILKNKKTIKNPTNFKDTFLLLKLLNFEKKIPEEKKKNYF